jgi:hypothetical protein
MQSLELDCEGAEFEIITSIREDMAARIENILFGPHRPYATLTSLSSIWNTLATRDEI